VTKINCLFRCLSFVQWRQHWRCESTPSSTWVKVNVTIAHVYNWPSALLDYYYLQISVQCIFLTAC